MEQPRPVDKMFILAMDKSIVEWRQQTTLLPMIQMNPLPFPYYRNMVMLLIVFEVVVAFKIALNGFAPLDRWERAEEFFMDTLLFAAISLLCQSLFLTSATLLMPWQKDMEKEKGAGQSDSMPVLALPAEYYILVRHRCPKAAHRSRLARHAPLSCPRVCCLVDQLPLHGHRLLFSEFADHDTPPADRSSSIFLRPFHDEDSRMMQRFQVRTPVRSSSLPGSCTPLLLWSRPSGLTPPVDERLPSVPGHRYVEDDADPAHELPAARARGSPDLAEAHLGQLLLKRAASYRRHRVP